MWPVEYFSGEISQGTGILREVEVETGPLYLQCLSGGARNKTMRKKKLSYFKSTVCLEKSSCPCRKTDLLSMKKRITMGEFLVYLKGHTAEDLSLVAKLRLFQYIRRRMTCRIGTLRVEIFLDIIQYLN